jgi:dehydrogenase/reductase SDR family protein 12
MVATTVDTLLDRSIALGYGSVGLWARRRLPGWPADPPRMDGKVVLVTGAAGGLGLAAAKGYAALGASVRAVARSEERAAEAVDAVQQAVPGTDCRAAVCDVSSLASLQEFTARFSATEERLDVLVNNAGVMPPERTHSPDGVELMFATHVLGPWVLIDRLAPLLRTSAPSRVINVTSGGMYAQQVPEGDLQSESSEYDPKTFYARTKREQVIVTEQWAERLRGTGVVVHAMHPGWADTEGVQGAMPVFRTAIRPIIRSLEQGADTIVWLGAAPEALRESGLLWHDRRPRPTHYKIGASEDPAGVRADLWNECARLAGSLQFP